MYFTSILKLFIFSITLINLVLGVPNWFTASDGKNYLIEPDQKYNWYNAWHECARRDAQLVVLDSESKTKAVNGLVQKLIGHTINLWLGANDEYSPDKNLKRPFYWSPSGKQLSYAFWSPNNPENYQSQEHCAHIWAKNSNYAWNDNECTNKLGFICEENHFLTKYKKDLSDRREKVKKINSEISLKLKEIEKVLEW